MIIYNSVVRKTFGLISFFVFPLSVFAQKWEVGVGAGICHYKGDIMPTFKPFVARTAGNIFIRMNWTRSISLKAQGLYGGLYGNDKFIKSDPYHQARGHSFTATVLEASGQIEYNFANFRTTSSRIVHNWTPYVFGGYGGTSVKTKAKLASINVPSFSSSTRPNFISLGIGFKKEWKNQWNWGIEFGSRWTNTDIIDSIGYNSDGQVSQQTITAINQSPVLSFPYSLQKNQIPGTKVMDMYYYTNFSISYVFYKVHCPTRR